VPSTWVLYGLAGSQLSDGKNGAHPLTFQGKTTTVSAFMGSAFGIYPGLVPWTPLILLAHIVFVRVTSILALRYLNFLRR